MFISNPEFLHAFLPIGPYYLYKSGRMRLLLMMGFYCFEIISILGVAFQKTFWSADLACLVFLCSGLICLSFSSNINYLFILRNGKVFSKFIVRLFLCLTAHIFLFLYAIKNNELIINSSFYLSMYLSGFFILIFSAAFISLRLPDR